jgi:hypothetical protein
MSSQELPLIGVEPVGVTSQAATPLRQTTLSRAAKSDAFDPTLRELIDAWPEVPEAVRRAVLVFVRTAMSK